MIAVLQGKTTKLVGTTAPAYIATIVMIEFCVAFAVRSPSIPPLSLKLIICQAMYPSIIIVILEVYGSFLDSSERPQLSDSTMDIPMSDSEYTPATSNEKSSHDPHSIRFSPIRFADHAEATDAQTKQHSIKKSSSSKKLEYLTGESHTTFSRETDGNSESGDHGGTYGIAV